MTKKFQEAIKEAKNTPATSGVLVNPNDVSGGGGYIPPVLSTTTTTPAPPIVTTPVYVSGPNALLDNSQDHYKLHAPNVYIRPHSEPHDNIYPSSTPLPPITTYSPVTYVAPSTTVSPITSYYSSTPSVGFSSPIVVPSDDLRPPFPKLDDSLSPIALYSPSTTPASPTHDYGPPIAAYRPNEVSSIRPAQFSAIPSSTFAPDYSTATLAGHTIEQINNELEPPKYALNEVSPPTISTPPSLIRNRGQFTPIYSSFSSTTTPAPLTGEVNNNVGYNARPLFDRNAYYRTRPVAYPYYQPQPQINNQLDYGWPKSQAYSYGGGYNRYFPYYDGVSSTANGFRYFLPRQYHEENNRDPQHREGSFGYIDPFGIRRVIYYNTSPERGFVHRQNNRYVGFQATPYDPRPS